MFVVCLPRCVHGTCQDGQNCVCDLGYEGPLCADKQCQLPCKNGGVCFKSDFQQLQCQCAEGWQGPICGEKACTLPCVRGSCRYTTPMEMSIRGSSVYCNCPNGWRGRLCDEVIPDPAGDCNCADGVWYWWRPDCISYCR